MFYASIDKKKFFVLIIDSFTIDTRKKNLEVANQLHLHHKCINELFQATGSVLLTVINNPRAE
jgi:hypothetical protein